MDDIMVMAFSFGQPGLFEILLVVLILIMFFGAKRLPELARSLGRSIQEFKQGRRDGLKTPPEKDEDKKDKPKDETPPAEKPPTA